VPNRRSQHRPGPGELPIHRLRRQAELTIDALRQGGRLERCDLLLVALVRTTAEVADERRDDPAQAFHLTQALKLLTELDGRLRTVAGPADDGFAELLAAVTAPSPPWRPPLTDG
jgi:hypothetical protein